MATMDTVIQEINLRDDAIEKGSNATTAAAAAELGSSPTPTSSDSHKDVTDNHTEEEKEKRDDDDDNAHPNTAASDEADTPPATHNQHDADTTDDRDPELDGPADETEPLSAVKHQLQCSWTLWYDYPNKKAVSWEDNLQHVYTFNTVEDFWSVFNHIKPPSALGNGSNYHLFKEGIRPMWEDQANKLGGKWLVTPDRGDKELDKWWLNTVMACIGETFEPGEEICGVVVSLRKDKNRLALWTKTANDENLCLQIGREFRQYAELGQHVRIAYMVHEDALKSSSTFRNKGRYRL